MNKMIFIFFMFYIFTSINISVYANENNIEIDSNVSIEVITYDELPDNIKEQLKTVEVNTSPRNVVPSNGYLYEFDNYKSISNTLDWEFDAVEIVKYSNEQSVPHLQTYIQQSTVCKTAYVDNFIGESKEINALINEIEKELGFSTDFKKTWKNGSSSGLNFTIPPNENIYVINHCVSVNSYGIWKYKRYTPSGSFTGYYYKYGSGNMISNTHNNFVVY